MEWYTDHVKVLGAGVPNEELFWTFVWVQARSLEGGRMDVYVRICDRSLQVLCLVRQTILDLDVKRLLEKDAKWE